MNIIITREEATKDGLWPGLIAIGIHPTNCDEEIRLTLEEAKELGIWIE